MSEGAAACSTCHRVAGKAFAEFAEWSTGTGNDYFKKITDSHKTFPANMWMPPRLDGLAARELRAVALRQGRRSHPEVRRQRVGPGMRVGRRPDRPLRLTSLGVRSTVMGMGMPLGLRETFADFRAACEREWPGKLERLVLFGSWARGEANEDSDVDVLVLLREATFSERSRAIELLATAAFVHRLVLAPLVLTCAEWDELERRERLLPREITRDGIDA